MASIKVKYRPSATNGKEGSIYYQVIHRRTVRQIGTDFRVFDAEWNKEASSVRIMPETSENRKRYLHSVAEHIGWDIRRLQAIIAQCDHGFGVNNTGLAVFLDFSESIERLGIDVVRQRYGNLFDMYEEITDVNPGELAKEMGGRKYYNPMMIYPAIHYTMGGIWVDYELQTTIKGLFAIGECNFSDHGANRLGASALMQGLADGYFVLPYTIQNYLSDQITVPRFSTDLPEFAEAEKAVQAKIDHLMNIKGKKSVDSIHKELGRVMWEYVGMGRTAEGLKKGIAELKEIRKEFETNLFIPGSKEGMNVELDKAIRLYDFITMGELVAYDALNRNESCGGHFREEYQTEEGEAKRDDENFFYVACWEYQGDDEKAPVLHKEPLVYEAIKVQTRNYKS